MDGDEVGDGEPTKKNPKHSGMRGAQRAVVGRGVGCKVAEEVAFVGPAFWEAARRWDSGLSYARRCLLLLLLVFSSAGESELSCVRERFS